MWLSAHPSTAQPIPTGSTAGAGRNHTLGAAQCPIWRVAKAIVDGMGIPPHVLTPEFGFCYCGSCADYIEGLGDITIYTRNMSEMAAFIRDHSYATIRPKGGTVERIGAFC